MNISRMKQFEIGTADEPHFTLHRGHVGVREFNKAFLERWDGDRIHKDDIKHEWWTEKKLKTKSVFKQATKETKGAKPFTVSYW